MCESAGDPVVGVFALWFFFMVRTSGTMMKWLRDLFKAAPDAAAPREAEAPNPVDWISVENLLVRLSDEHLRRFAETHGHETFYGFGFDCNAETAEILLCANTREGLLASARETLQAYPQFHIGKSIEDVANALEWSFGDWVYQGFNLGSAAWDEDWSDAQVEVSNALNLLLNNLKHEHFEALKSEFMVMACRALLRVAGSDAMATLKKATGFRVLCTDHDEGPEDGFKRLSAVAVS
jgi:Domain of unknown function (DUF4303)